jgi:uncharacterized protein YbjT (DUF2867 family)
MILVTEATSNVGRHVVSELPGTSAAVRGFVRNPHSVGLPGDGMRGDLTVLDTLGACLDEVEAVFLIWFFFMAEAALAFLDAVTKHARRVVYLSPEDVGDDLEQQTDTITARIAT